MPVGVRWLVVLKVPLFPKNPDRVCWGCDKYCPADALDCGNGTVRTQHPIEIFGEDWLEFGREREEREKQLEVAGAATGISAT